MGEPDSTKKPSGGWRITRILVVISVIALLVMGVYIHFLNSCFDCGEDAKPRRTKTQIRQLDQALQIFYLDNGFHPTTTQGLQALVEKPTTEPIPANYKKDGYLPQIPKDPWANDYIYVNPGPHGEPFSIVSLGSDGKPGGEEGAADIESWDLQ
jgi:general secretion pathway protein G